MTLEESWLGTKPDIANLCVFGCPAYVLIPKEIRVGKLAHKTQRCTFIGYSSTQKAWHFWNPVKRSVIESRDVVFDEHVQCCSHPMPLVDLSMLEHMDGFNGEVSPVDTSPIADSYILTSHPKVDPHCAAPLAGLLALAVPLLVALPPVLALVDPLPIVPLSPPASPQVCQHHLNEVEHLFDFFEHHPLHNDREGAIPAQIEGEGAVPAWIEGEDVDAGLGQLQASLAMLALELGSVGMMEDVVVLTVATDTDVSVAPSSLHEALQRPDAKEWTEAIHWEIDSLMHTNTFVEVEQVPALFTPIGSKFVFSIKRDVDGKVVQYKACLVAQGFSQREGIDYTNTFALVVRLTSIHITLTIATSLDLKMDHLDVETVFLNGRIDEEIYMQAPKGFERLGLDVGSLWRLHGSLYSLKQALLVWNKLLDGVLKSFGWRRLLSDWCIYVWCDSRERLMILAVHVDDMLLAGNSCELMEEVKTWLAKHFKIKDMGSPKLVVGLEVICNTEQGTTSISQGHFVDKLAI